MLLGFVAGRYLSIQRKTIGALLLYIFIPVVYFGAVATTPLSLATLSLPVLFFLLCSGIATVSLFLGKFVWGENPLRHICAQASGGGNYGYFAIPVAAAIFDHQTAGLVVLAGLGYVLYENTVGFYIAERGKKSIKKSLLALEKLPALWATVVGIIFNVAHLPIDQNMMNVITNFRGGFTILGMMLIGLGLSSIKFSGFKLDKAYLGMTFFAKFVIWPVIIGCILYLDTTLFHFYTPMAHKVMLLMAIIPLAANTIVYAITLKINPENVAMAVLLSALFALFFIPLVAVRFLL